MQWKDFFSPHITRVADEKDDDDDRKWWEPDGGSNAPVWLFANRQKTLKKWKENDDLYGNASYRSVLTAVVVNRKGTTSSCFLILASGLFGQLFILMNDNIIWKKLFVFAQVGFV